MANRILGFLVGEVARLKLGVCSIDRLKKFRELYNQKLSLRRRDFGLCC